MITKSRWFFPFLILLSVGILAVIFSSQNLSDDVGKNIIAGDVAWMLTATALVLLMTPGLSFFYGGMVQKKNVISIMLQSFIAMGIISILWVVVGFSLAFGNSIYGFIGNPFTYFMFNGVGSSPNPNFAATIPFLLFALFQLKFAIITPALITGSFAERVRFSSYILFILLFSIFIYAPIAHWTWHPDGFLRKLGILDFAGGTVVHMSAGLAALAGALVLGRRKLHKNNKSHAPANIPFVLLGTGMLWFGWFGFNAGSALAASGLAVHAFATTNMASASAMLGWIAVDGLRGKKPSALGACVGAVVGLVAITPAAGYVSIGASILIGIIASIASNCVAHWRSKSTIDDTLDVFPCHGVGGMVGMLLTGIFASKIGLLYGHTELFFSHLLGLAIVTVYAFFGSYFLLKITDKIIPLRVPEAAEEIGLDLAQHGETIIN